jgi:hypothetical protein
MLTLLPHLPLCFCQAGSGFMVQSSSGNYLPSSPSQNGTAVMNGAGGLNGSNGAASGAGGDLQEKIAAARRQADGLKEQIRSKKDQMADTSCESPALKFSVSPIELNVAFLFVISASNGSGSGPTTTNRNEATTYAKRPSRQDLRHALGQ